MWLVNSLGVALIVGIIWWFWLWKPKAIRVVSGNSLTVAVENGSYQPAQIVVPVGRKTTLYFLRKDPSPCASTVVLAQWGISAELPLDKEVQLAIEPQSTGVFPFTCQMQMYRGEIHVVDNDESEEKLMTDSTSELQPRCVFCHMDTTLRYLKLDLCEICRDQVYDFLWVSAVQAMVAVVFSLGVLFFLIEEVLLFIVLVIVKHKIPPPWQQGDEGCGHDKP